MIVTDLRKRIAERLDPLSAWEPGTVPAQSDFDLNPEFRPAEPPRGGLTGAVSQVSR